MQHIAKGKQGLISIVYLNIHLRGVLNVVVRRFESRLRLRKLNNWVALLWTGYTQYLGSYKF